MAMYVCLDAIDCFIPVGLFPDCSRVVNNDCRQGRFKKLVGVFAEHLDFLDYATQEGYCAMSIRHKGDGCWGRVFGRDGVVKCEIVKIQALHIISSEAGKPSGPRTRATLESVVVWSFNWLGGLVGIVRHKIGW